MHLCRVAYTILVAIMLENLVKLGLLVPERCLQVDRQHRPTDVLITILRSPNKAIEDSSFRPSSF